MQLRSCSTTEEAAKSLHAWDDGGRLERKLGNIGEGECLEDVYKLSFVNMLVGKKLL